MIRDVEISNFQSHKHALLSLSDGLSIITGRTHSGKSSIFRAIRWALQNNPRGDKFRNDDMLDDESVSVSISFSEDTFISREKNPNKGMNRYITSEHEDSFDAIKTNVPDEINAITKLKEENLQSQGDRYFLLGKTPGQVSSEYNRVVGLQIIDDVRKKIKKVVSDTSSKIGVLDSQIEETKNLLESPEFQTVDELYALAKSIESKNEERIDKFLLIELVTDIIDGMKIQKKISEDAKKTIKIEKLLKPIEDKINSFEAKEAKMSSVEIILSDIDVLKESILEAEEIMSYEAEILSYEKKVNGLADRRFELDKISSLVRDIGDSERTKSYMLQTIAEREKTKSELEKELEILLSYCQVCGSDKEHWNLDRIE